MTPLHWRKMASFPPNPAHQQRAEIFPTFFFLAFHCLKMRNQKKCSSFFVVWVGWFTSVIQSCPTLWDPMDCSMPGFPVLHQLLELAQTHVHEVSDAIQSSHPLSSPSPPAFNVSQHQRLFKCLILHIRWPKYWSFSFSISPSNEYSELISFRIDWWISLQSKGLSRAFFNTTVQQNQFFGAQLSLYSKFHIHTWPLEKPRLD